MALILKNCQNCNSQYVADNRNLNRGWGLSCSKSCAAVVRENLKSVLKFLNKEYSTKFSSLDDFAVYKKYSSFLQMQNHLGKDYSSWYLRDFIERANS